MGYAPHCGYVIVHSFIEFIFIVLQNAEELHTIDMYIHTYIHTYMDRREGDKESKGERAGVTRAKKSQLHGAASVCA